MNLQRQKFADTYLMNGGIAEKAAIDAGYSASRSRQTGCVLLKNKEISEYITRARMTSAERVGITLEKTLKLLWNIANFDPGELYDVDGNVKPWRELAEHVRKAIGTVEVEQENYNKFDEDGNILPSSGVTIKVKPWEKTKALDMIMKHLGAYEKDNAQKPAAINVTNVQIVFQ